MNITSYDVPHHLNQQTRKTFIYLITGDELLLVEESVQAIMTQARAEGYAERCIIETEMSNAIDQFLSHTQNLSFFSTKKMIEVRFHQKITSAWMTVLSEIVYPADPNQMIILRMPKLSRGDTQAKWYKTLEKNGCVITIWPLKKEAFHRWIQSRCMSVGIKISKENILRIAENTEGNLLAASQIIEKLQLIEGSSSNMMSDQTVHEALSDYAHFNLFELCDAILAQKSHQCLKILATLKNQGTEPPLILWALTQDLQHLIHFSELDPSARNNAYTKKGIWGTRQALFQRILTQITSTTHHRLLSTFIHHARRIDAIIKGIESGDVWLELEIFCLTLSSLMKTTR